MTDPTPATDTPDDPTPDVLAGVYISMMEFTGAEELEMEKHFDCDYASLMQAVFRRLRNDPDTGVKLIDADRRVRPTSEVLRYMIWVWRRRTVPTAKLEDTAALGWFKLVKVLYDPPKAGRTATKSRRR